MTYEILTIASSENAEKGQQDLSKKIKDLISQEKGKTISEESLGTKKLATPVEKQETGTYLSIVAELKPESIQDIQKSLQSSGEIINVFIFKIAEKKVAKVVKKKVPVKKVAKAEKKVEKAPKIKLKKKVLKPESKSEITTEIKGEEDRLKKLDEKLDEILKE